MELQDGPIELNQIGIRVINSNYGKQRYCQGLRESRTPFRCDILATMNTMFNMISTDYHRPISHGHPVL